MPQRASRILASLALAASLTAPASAAPRALEQGLFARLAGWVEEVFAAVLQAEHGLASAWDKEGMSPDPDGTPRPAPPPNHLDEGQSPDPNG